MSKINLIKAIVEFHPTAEAGRKRDWNHYTGGMADSGDWYFRKLMDATDEELMECLWEMCYEEARHYKMKWLMALCDCVDTRTQKEKMHAFLVDMEAQKWFPAEDLARAFYEQCKVTEVTA